LLSEHDTRYRSLSACLVATLGRDTTVKLSLELGANVHVKHGRALHAATKRCDERIVQLLLDRGANPNARSWWEATALQVALQRGYERLVDLLLRGWSRATAVETHWVKGYHRIARLLIDRGADINVPGGLWHETLCEDVWNI
jgi:hypothetical protein